MEGVEEATGELGTQQTSEKKLQDGSPSTKCNDFYRRNPQYPCKNRTWEKSKVNKD